MSHGGTPCLLEGVQPDTADSRLITLCSRFDRVERQRLGLSFNYKPGTPEYEAENEIIERIMDVQDMLLDQIEDHPPRRSPASAPSPRRSVWRTHGAPRRLGHDRSIPGADLEGPGRGGRSMNAPFKVTPPRPCRLGEMCLQRTADFRHGGSLAAETRRRVGARLAGSSRGFSPTCGCVRMHRPTLAQRRRSHDHHVRTHAEGRRGCRRGIRRRGDRTMTPDQRVAAAELAQDLGVWRRSYST